MKHRVLVEDPHVGSLAARILLQSQLRKEELEEWFAFRAEFLQKKKAEQGVLRCHYCGKEGLVEEVNEFSDVGSDMLATIDHVVPVSKGGSVRDENNLVVACYPCNQRKADNVVGKDFR
jgi:5-methylcytosine-specific restriction endonuclease McrA